MLTSALVPVSDTRGELERLFQLPDRLFERVLGYQSPQSGAPVAFYEEAERFTLEWELPGVQQSDIHLAVEGRQLLLKAKRSNAPYQERKTWIQERAFGEFQRSITLPEAVDMNAIQATLKDGVLTVILEKSKSAQPQVIPVTAG